MGTEKKDKFVNGGPPSDAWHDADVDVKKRLFVPPTERNFLDIFCIIHKTTICKVLTKQQQQQQKPPFSAYHPPNTYPPLFPSSNLEAKHK